MRLDSHSGNTESVVDLVTQLNSDGGQFDYILTDVTGQAPGYKGMAERFAFIYNKQRISTGQLVSDITLDRTAVLSNIKNAYSLSIDAEIDTASANNILHTITNVVERFSRTLGTKLNTFVQFIRSPHIVEFHVKGLGGRYELLCTLTRIWYQVKPR